MFLWPWTKKTHQPPQSGKPYIIWAPPYFHRSAGIRVLHKLAYLLNKAGQRTFIYINKTNPKWRVPRISKRKAQKLIKLGAIVVYPEIVAGNPLGAKTVARYILNNPGLLGGEKTYDQAEILFCYGKHLLQPGMTEDRILTIPAIRTDIFYRDDKVKRDIDYLVYFGKHPAVPGYPKKNIITMTKPSNPVKLGQMLRRCKKLISYDNLTALTTEATLCGCPVVMIPDGFRKRSDLENAEFGFNGIAWGESPEEWSEALASLDQAPKILEQVTQQTEKCLQSFIAITQNEAKKCL
ncbi:hypothetical protein A2291_04225 [candidate division WOR-1 bacterium RIFOXYB2_FULL_42_35]|uniref:Glycosyl transferase family 1 domain-containing protein n=1 Tax=candidate division WOR-1 bacterium RIFOXYC2_FULL_41_25 TaxID=1802586 RepID=A0A1F4TND1_UNCSA|nr:MAG: hypothetical protein A2247_01065 [candidate division WOR-1 bacterium RIFOXYA2_FULL_41_14]OGC24338.1 MAG: hypothetical protein A2291_04225 [candidate division WOR-1 bacterium RIFOXYB2_FULL_42_35]OGC34040.1 MAG: hypothetical protein A2462_01630 [candidate division WOR-1 bacterium RIFOXYC2_FULL_41_25]OGC43822.1 MAG: hypothetical protein A2548_08000 [candidate division WOR-1 bacterium RIFOXYD2_FULL_41_8]